MGEYLVTGGAGFIGSHIVEALVQAGESVRVLDNFATGRRENLDGVQVIFHEAALPSVPRSIADPIGSNHANIDGTVALLWAAHQAKVQRVVYAASSSAYGNSPQFPRVETIMPEPLSPYAVAKLAGEHYCRAFYECFGLETISLRYFNIFGPRQNPLSQYAAAVPLFTTAIMEDRSPTIFGDGEQSRDFTYVANAVRANLLAAEAPSAACGKVYNVGCGGAVTVNEVVAAINQLLGKNVPSEHVDPRPGDVRHSHADISLARKHLKYDPVVSFEDGLRKTVGAFTTSQK